jgi:hypothetical protein
MIGCVAATPTPVFFLLLTNPSSSMSCHSNYYSSLTQLLHLACCLAAILPPFLILLVNPSSSVSCHATVLAAWLRGCYTPAVFIVLTASRSSHGLLRSCKLQLFFSGLQKKMTLKMV